MVHINSCILLAYLQFKPICQWFNSLILITVLPSDITSSRWVGGGQVAAPGSVRVAASVLFPAAPKHLTLSFSLNLGVFEWPMNGSNMSGYLSVPRDLAVVVYRKLEDGQEAPISWEDAQAEGVGEFAVRGVVAPCSSEEVFFQLAAVPFSIDHISAVLSSLASFILTSTPGLARRKDTNSSFPFSTAQIRAVF